MAPSKRNDKWEEWRVGVQQYWAYRAARLASADDVISIKMTANLKSCLEYSFQKVTMKRGVASNRTPAGDMLEQMKIRGGDESLDDWALAFAIETDGADPKEMHFRPEREQACYRMREVYIAAARRVDQGKLNTERLAQAAQALGITKDMAIPWPKGSEAGHSRIPIGDWRKQTTAISASIATPTPTPALRVNNTPQAVTATNSTPQSAPQAGDAVLPTPAPQTANATSRVYDSAVESLDSQLETVPTAVLEQAANLLTSMEDGATIAEATESARVGDKLETASLCSIEVDDNTGLDLTAKEKTAYYNLIQRLRRPNSGWTDDRRFLNKLSDDGKVTCNGETCYVALADDGSWTFQGQLPHAAKQLEKTIDFLKFYFDKGYQPLPRCEVDVLLVRKSKLVSWTAAEIAMLDDNVIHSSMASVSAQDNESIETRIVRLFVSHLGLPSKPSEYLHLRTLIRGAREQMFHEERLDNWDRLREDIWQLPVNWDDTMRGRDWIEPLRCGGFFSDDEEARKVYATLTDCLTQDRKRLGYNGQRSRPTVDLIDRCFDDPLSMPWKLMYAAAILQTNWIIPPEMARMTKIWSVFADMRAAVEGEYAHPQIPHFAALHERDIAGQVCNQVKELLQSQTADIIKNLDERNLVASHDIVKSFDQAGEYINQNLDQRNLPTTHNILDLKAAVDLLVTKLDTAPPQQSPPQQLPSQSQQPQPIFSSQLRGSQLGSQHPRQQTSSREQALRQPETAAAG